MAKEIIMPKNGMDMKEGVLIKWLVEIGDRVEKGDPIMEIETDKVTMDSEAPETGIILAKYAEEGATIPVLTVIGYIGEAGESVPERVESIEETAGHESAPAESRATSAIGASAAPGPEDDAQVDTPVQVDGVSSERYDYDVAVIGGGPAGYVAAITAAQLGGRAILFEKEKVGGTCLNRGCIPAKTYLKTAEYLHHIRHAEERGIVSDSAASIDMPRARAHKDTIVGKLTSGVDALLKSNKVRVVHEEAKLHSAHEVKSDSVSCLAAKVILCGGSKVAVPPIPGIDHPGIWTSDDAFLTEEIPDRLVILGGGVIGCELAAVFRAFGSHVQIVEMLPRPVANMDASISEALRGALESDGIEILTGTAVRSIEAHDGIFVVVTEDRRLECDKVLLATGRVPDLGCLDALAEAIEIRGGTVVVNDKMETGLDGVYAAGDITGRIMLAHAASKMSETAAKNAMGENAVCDLKYTPSCIYTLPEAASVGMTEEDARSRYGNEISIGIFPFTANGRALASGGGDGFVKVLIEKNYGEILGVHIVGGNASEIIMEPAALMCMEVTAFEVVSDIVHAHPTYAEAFMEACADALGQSVHLLRRVDE